MIGDTANTTGFIPNKRQAKQHFQTGRVNFTLASWCCQCFLELVMADVNRTKSDRYSFASFTEGSHVDRNDWANGKFYFQICVVVLIRGYTIVQSIIYLPTVGLCGVGVCGLIDRLPSLTALRS